MVTIFKKEIDEFTFPKVNSTNSENSTLENSTLIYKYIKDTNKIKNSIENFSKKNNKNFTENNLKKEKGNLIEKKEKKRKKEIYLQNKFCRISRNKTNHKIQNFTKSFC